MDEREELAALLPPLRHRLPEGRRRALKEQVMAQITVHEHTRRRRRGVAMAAAAVCAAGAAFLLASPSPAYALRDNPDGTITVHIYEAKDPKGLQAELRGRGVNAVVDYMPVGKTCKQPRSTTWAPGVRLASPLTAEEEADGPGFRIDPSVLRPGQTAVLEFVTEEVGGEFVQAGVRDMVSDGPVGDCVLVDAR
ncbi:hypothetical protein FXF51_21865 [Nonomuraea sp. PA05]|uniref:hypothetical protein n=1 Tax=Nonomuraea sp. PA05 TaxID=2604466 RepID=UPI0011D5B027|nr:hypothetical protein [Nonomuraea sp. PA05]TYB64365.1 hypothetical protein FXF51_21865 [Nonomuraea sp. PA05]